MHRGGRGDRAQGGARLRPLPPRASSGARGGGGRLTEGLRIVAAPITWGICEVPGWGRQLDLGRVLSEIAGAGLTATELGPRGFLPEDPARIQARLAVHGLRAEARDADRTTVISIETDPSVSVGSFESWWEVPVAKTSEQDSVRAARNRYEEDHERERRFV